MLVPPSIKKTFQALYLGTLFIVIAKAVQFATKQNYPSICKAKNDSYMDT